MSGIVYLVVNEAMPGLVKIGKTSNADPQVRIDSLYKGNTSVPTPFECKLAMRVEKPDEVERALHTAFEPERVNPNREFFKVDVGRVQPLLKLLGNEDVTPSVRDSNVGIPSNEMASIERLREQRPRYDFFKMGLPVEAEIRFSQTGAVARVKDSKKVEFEGTLLTLGYATGKALGKTHHGDWRSNWTYEGATLGEIYDVAYESGEL